MDIEKMYPIVNDWNWVTHFEKAIVTASEQTEETLTEEKNDTNG